MGNTPFNLDQYSIHSISHQTLQCCSSHNLGATKVIRYPFAHRIKTASFSDECHGIVVDHVHYYITPLAMTVEVGDEHDEFDPSDYKVSKHTHWGKTVARYTHNSHGRYALSLASVYSKD